MALKQAKLQNFAKMLQAFEKLSLSSSQYFSQLNSQELILRLKNCPPIQKLDGLQIINFKSFEGRKYVGPFLEFTSIVGPNGVGKSNVFEAINFCFCNERSHSYYDIRQFIQRKGTQTYKEMSRQGKICQVQVRFKLTDGTILTISRSLDAQSQQQFKIDGDEYPKQAYKSFLMRNNINVFIPNYGLWQHQVNNHMLKGPNELSNYIDHVSGSITFKAQHQNLQDQLKTIEKQLEDKSAQLIKTKTNLKNIKMANTLKGKQAKIQEEYEQLSQKQSLLKAYISELGIRQHEKDIQGHQKEEEKAMKAYNEQKAKLQRDHSQKMNLQQHLIELRKQTAQDQKLLRLNSESQYLFDAQDAQKLKRQVDDLNAYLKNLNKNKQESEKELNDVQSSDVSKQFLDLYKQWENENTAANKQFLKRKQNYLYNQNLLQAKKTILQNLKLEQEVKNKTASEHQKNLIQLKQSLTAIEKLISQIQLKEQSKISQFRKNQQQIETVAVQLSEINRSISVLENIIDEALAGDKDKDLIKKLSGIDGFKGMLGEWVQPIHKKYEQCFEQILGGKLKYLLCLNESTSKLVSLKLKQNLVQRDVIILSNIKQKKISLTRSQLGKLGVFAIDAVEYSKDINNLQIFLRQSLDGKAICQNMKDAFKLINSNIRGLNQVYTLDGHILRSDGLFTTSGYVQPTKKKFKYLNRTRLMEELQTLNQKKNELESKIASLKNNADEREKIRNQMEIGKLKKRRQELLIKQAHLQKISEGKREVKIPQDLEKEIKKLIQNSKQLQSGMKQIEKDMSNNHIFQNFLKKNKMTVESFRNISDLSSLESSVRLRTKLAAKVQEYARQILSNQQKLKTKQQKLDKLNEKVKEIKLIQGKEQMNKLKQKIKRQQSQIQQIKSKLSKLKDNETEFVIFKPKVQQMKAKLDLLKSQHLKLIESIISDQALQEKAIKGDYSLIKQGIDVRGINELRQWGKSLEKEQEALQLQIQKLYRNDFDVSRITQSLETLKLQSERIQSQLQQLALTKAEKQQKLTNVKVDRGKLFMNFIKELKPYLQQAYACLTLLENKNIYGKAEIFADNQTFPFQQGLFYCPTPPYKRYVYNIDVLSGGQKAIAGLALQFAVAVASSSPFLILDETDTHLDLDNANRFLKLIHSTIKRKKMQFIIVSHKKSVFLRSMSLVGLTKPLKNPFTQAYSLRLTDDIKLGDNPSNENEILRSMTNK